MELKSLTMNHEFDSIVVDSTIFIKLKETGKDEEFIKEFNKEHSNYGKAVYVSSLLDVEKEKIEEKLPNIAIIPKCGIYISVEEEAQV